MKITKKVLSIPPYVSTTWDYIASLSIDTDESGKILVIDFENGKTIRIPSLSSTVLDEVFETHMLYLEEETEFVQESPDDLGTASKEALAGMNPQSMLSFGFPLSLPPEVAQNLGDAMQHNPQMANAPDLPSDVVEKLSNVAKALGVESEALGFGEFEPHCNCLHCQIVRGINGETKPESTHTEEVEESVSDEDLQFREWNIEQKEEQLFNVCNPINEDESYQVYLGKPICCTCGMTDCDHIKAVLRS